MAPPSLESLFASARTRELPNNIPYLVIKEFIGTYVERWDNPSRQLFELTRKELMGQVKSLVELHFSQYTHGHLKQGIMYTLHCLSEYMFHIADIA